MANSRWAQTVERVHYRDPVESVRQVDKGREGPLLRKSGTNDPLKDTVNNL